METHAYSIGQCNLRKGQEGEAGRRASRRSGKNAYFLTFSVSFSDIVTQLGTRGITEDFLFSYVIFTATQADSLNQDLNGLDKNYDPSATWSSLGLVSNGMSPTGVAVVPEVCHSFRLWRC